MRYLVLLASILFAIIYSCIIRDTFAIGGEWCIPYALAGYCLYKYLVERNTNER